MMSPFFCRRRSAALVAITLVPKAWTASWVLKQHCPLARRSVTNFLTVIIFQPFAMDYCGKVTLFVTLVEWNIQYQVWQLSYRYRLQVGTAPILGAFVPITGTLKTIGITERDHRKKKALVRKERITIRARISLTRNYTCVCISCIVYMKMPITICLKKAFIIDNQLDRNFYIRGRHEDADNSLCKSWPVMLIHALTGFSS